MMDFIMDYIIGPFLGFLLICCVLGIVIGIPVAIKNENEISKKVEFCFMQEPRTKECEYILWQYELGKKEPKHHTTVMPMPLVIRR